MIIYEGSTAFVKKGGTEGPTGGGGTMMVTGETAEEGTNHRFEITISDDYYPHLPDYWSQVRVTVEVLP